MPSIKIHYGWCESQSRLVMMPDGSGWTESRVISYDRSGSVIELKEWRPLMRVWLASGKQPWWRRLIGFWLGE